MGQYWYIVLMDAEEFLDCGKLGEFLWNEEAKCLVDLLAVPLEQGPVQSSSALTSQEKVLGIQSPRKDREPRQTYPCLAAMPDEVILEIIENLGFLSCFRLSLVSRQLWRIGWPVAQQKITDLMGPWAGKRLICLGDECAPGDWPAGFLTAEEEDEANEGLDEDEVDDDEGFFQRPGDLLSVARCRFQRIRAEYDPYEILEHTLPGLPKRPPYSQCSQTRQLPRTAHHEAGHLPRAEYSEVLAFIYGKNNARYYPETESWILRNLTTSEFVQGDELFAAFPRTKRPRGPHLGFPGFGDAVLCRICWSTRHSTAPPQTAFSRGIWAGHSFEICAEKVHASKSDSTWKDVTSEIIEELSLALDLPRQAKSDEEVKDQTQ